MLDPAQSRSNRSKKDAVTRYYSKKASVYDSTIRPAERQPDMEELIGLIEKKMAGKKVLEVACGTGYWTQIIARRARFVRAVDINDEMLDRATTKLRGLKNTMLEKNDAYRLAGINELYDIGFGGFWWSHIPKQKIPYFLSTLSSKLKSEANVIMVDNNYVDGCSGPVTSVDAEGNTYQTRINDGCSYKVLKNFSTPEDIHTALEGFVKKVEVISLKHYWVFFATL